MRILIGIGLFVVVAFQACGKANFNGTSAESKDASVSSASTATGSASSTSVVVSTPAITPGASPAETANTVLVCDPLSGGTCATGSTAPTTGAGLIGHIYYLSQGSEVAQYLAQGQLLPLTVILSNLDVPNRSFSEGFPGADGAPLKRPDGSILNEWFLLDMNGNFTLPASMPEGQYEFATNSDDGSLLYLNNVMVVQNDGESGYGQRVQGCNVSMPLKHGIANPMKLDYFQGPGDKLALQVYVRAVDPAHQGCNIADGFQIIPPSSLSY